MKIGSYLFTPKLLFVALYLFIGATMCALGFWQLDRADEKIELQSAANQAASRAAIPLGSQATQPSNYTKVSLLGRFEAERQFLWDNRIYRGAAGFEVITPFRLSASSQLVLVNRGWVPIEGSRENLPIVMFDSRAAAPGVAASQAATPAAANGPLIVGIWTSPSIGFSSGDAVNLSSTEWPKVLQHFNYREIEAALGESVLAGLVQIQRQPVNESTGETVSSAISTVSDNVGGAPLYIDNWAPVAFGPERHYGYAFQWFAMFTALTILFVTLNLKNPGRNQDMLIDDE